MSDEKGVEKGSSPRRQFRFTEAAVRKVNLGSGLYRDANTPGFYLLARETRKVYVAQRDIAGRTVRVTIGDAATHTAAHARQRARELLVAMARGENPNEEKRRARARSITLREALDLHFAGPKRHAARTEAGYRNTLDLYLRDWLDWELVELGKDRRAVRERHSRVSREHGPYAANGVMRAFRAVYNSARREHPELPEAPTIAVRMNRERRRSDKAIAPEDLAAWYGKLAKVGNPIRRDYHLLVLFTGLRRESAAQIKWSDVDLAKAALFVPRPKGGADRAFTLPVPRYLVDLLRQAKRRNEQHFSGASHVFPARLRGGTVGPLREPKEDGLPSPHALRHTYASVANAIGVSETNLKLLLNHRSVNVTQGYVAAYLKELQREQERIAAFLLEHLKPPRREGNRGSAALMGV